jgi:hypothetical protein
VIAFASGAEAVANVLKMPGATQASQTRYRQAVIAKLSGHNQKLMYSVAGTSLMHRCPELMWLCQPLGSPFPSVVSTSWIMQFLQ